MRLACAHVGHNIQLAVEVDGQLFAWSDVVPDHTAATTVEALPLLCDGPPAVRLDGAKPLRAGSRLLAPLPHPPRDLICLGKNFAEHAAEFDAAMKQESDELPSAPIVFTKATTSVCGPGDVVTVDPAVTREVDYEGELAVVIGKEARWIPAEKAFDYVAGYTILNDLTARDLQRKHQQWFIGKSIDGFAPMGPTLVSKDEIGDPGELRISTYVDGELRQRGRGDMMIFDIPYVVSLLSTVMTLKVGDIIAMGTPKGVGVGFEPPRFLGDGAQVEVEVSDIGRLVNTIRFEDHGN